MYKASDKFHASILGDNRKFISKIKIDGESINSEIVSVRYTAYASESQLFSVGGTASAYVEISIWNPGVSLEGKEIEVIIGMDFGGALEEVPLGFFTAQKPVDDDGLFSFVAYDRIQSKMTGSYFSELTYPIDAKKALDEISVMTGVPIDTSTLPDGIILEMKVQSTEKEVDENGDETDVVTYTEPFNGYTYREALGYIAQLYTRYAIVDRTGTIRFKWFASVDGIISATQVVQPLFYYDIAANMARTDAEYEVINGYLTINESVIYGNNASEYYYENDYIIKKNRYYDDLVLDSAVFSVNGIVCQNESGTVTSGNEYGNVEFSNPVMSQNFLDKIYDSVKNIEFVPASVSFMGDICLDICDVVEVQSKKGYNVAIPIMGIVHDFDGGLLTSIYSYGASEDGSTSSSGPLAKSVDRTYTELFLVKELIGKKASFEYVYSIDAEFRKVVADYGQYKILIADQFKAIDAEFESLSTKYADIELANIKEGTIKNAMIGDAEITSAKINSVNAETITTGTLAVERLIIRGSKKSIIYEINNISGALQAENVDTINGEALTDRTINSKKIIAKSITAEEIDVENLFAQDIVASGTIRGLKIVGATGSFTGEIDAQTFIVKESMKLYLSDADIYETVIKAETWINTVKSVRFGLLDHDDSYIEVTKFIPEESGLDKTIITIGGNSDTVDIALNGTVSCGNILNVGSDANIWGKINVDNGIYFGNNNIPLYQKNVNGDYVSVVNLNKDDILAIGYGMYDENIGVTRIYGKDVSIFSREAGSYVRPYYRKGDSVTFGINTSGYVTGSGKNVRFLIPLNKPVIGSPTVAITSTNFILRQNNQYTHGSSSSEGVLPDSISVGTANGVGYYTSTSFPDTTNVVNNSSIGVQTTITLTFT